MHIVTSSFGEEHVGYKRLDFHSLKLSVIGGRPFSCGGERLFRKQLLAKRSMFFSFFFGNIRFQIIPV